MFLRKCGIHGQETKFCLQIEEFKLRPLRSSGDGFPGRGLGSPATASLAEVSAEVFKGSKRVKHRGHTAAIMFTTATWTLMCRN